MTSIPDWPQYKPASLNPTQAFNEAASPDAGASAGNSSDEPSLFQVLAAIAFVSVGPICSAVVAFLWISS